MKILDNINHTVREDLQDTMQKGSRVSIAAACFSIYAYQEFYFTDLCAGKHANRAARVLYSEIDPRKEPLRHRI